MLYALSIVPILRQNQAIYGRSLGADRRTSELDPTYRFVRSAEGLTAAEFNPPIQYIAADHVIHRNLSKSRR
jgi:hypothetical protein